MTQAWERVRRYLFGGRAIVGDSDKSAATGLIHEISHGGLRGLSDDRIMQLVGFLTSHHGMRTALRGNTRFLDSVYRQWQKKGVISARQRQGLLNVLEKAYPHNLAAELKNLF